MLLFCTKLQKVTLVVFPVKMTGLWSIAYKSVIMLYITKYWIQSFCQLVFFHLGLFCVSICIRLIVGLIYPKVGTSFFEWKNHFLWIIFTIWDKKLWKLALFITLVCFNVNQEVLLLNAFILYKLHKVTLVKNGRPLKVNGEEWK